MRWELVMECSKLSVIEPKKREDVADALEELIDVKAFVDSLNNSRRQARQLQHVGLTGWKDKVTDTIDE